MMNRRQFDATIAVSALLPLLGCSSASVVSRRDLGPPPAAAPLAVYVADFELDAGSISSEPGLRDRLPRPRILPSGPLRQRQDPQAEARELVDLMAKTIVEALEKNGLPARRTFAGAALPPEGWLVRGVFLQVDEGNRLRRAVVGFGAGETQMQVAAVTDDLSKGAPMPLYEVDTSAESGHMPGAVVTLNPIAAGVRFVMAGQDLDRNVRETATKIAEEVERHVKGAPVRQ